MVRTAVILLGALLLLFALARWHGTAGYVSPARIALEGTPEGRAAAVVAEPVQHNLWIPRIWKKSGYTIRGVAEFGLTGRVLLKDTFTSDEESDLAPVDFTFGWGPMSDPSFLKKVNLSHSGRFYRWTTADAADSDKISLHSANMHMIPGSKEVEKTLHSIQPGELVSLSGYLVNAERADSWTWTTSMTRDDTGDGACEIVWVDKIAH